MSADEDQIEEELERARRFSEACRAPPAAGSPSSTTLIGADPDYRRRLNRGDQGPSRDAYVMLRAMNEDGPLLGDAARAIGVSAADTLRRWERAGKLRTSQTTPTAGGVRCGGQAPIGAARAPPGGRCAVRTQPLPRRGELGRGRRRDGAGRDQRGPAPHHRGGHARRRRGAWPAPGVLATAAVKATSVMVEKGQR